MEIEVLKEFIQPANINFLVGSGVSRPYLSALGNIETLLTELNSLDETKNANIYNLIKGSIYREYFLKVIKPNIALEKENDDIFGDCSLVNDNYVKFLNTLNQIVHNRGGSLLSKQVNIYTTNIDTFFENAAEQSKVEFNDGFKGNITPTYDEGNFNKSYLKNSVHFQNVTELPVFNLLKMHGSINWRSKDKTQIFNDTELKLVSTIASALESVQDVPYLDIEDKTFAQLLSEATNTLSSNSQRVGQRLKTFLDEYEKLIMVNPTKRKFSETVLDMHFYELMRMYSNSLEKENSVLFVMGFSFADEHILSITKRAIRANPTLLLIIFAFSDADAASYSHKFADISNVKIITPSSYNKANNIDKNELKVSIFDFASINIVFDTILESIPVNFTYGRK